MAELAPPPSARRVTGRLPRTFGPSFNDQLDGWDLLFPAEQRQLRAQLDWLAQLPAPEFDRLFAPITRIEGTMDLPPTGGRRQPVTDAGILARSPHYPEWRAEVEKVFSRIGEGIGEAGTLPRAPRLLMCVLPAGLPIGQASLWPDLVRKGTWVSLDQPFSEMRDRLMRAVAGRERPAGMEDIERTWVFESRVASGIADKSPSVTLLSWTALAPARREFLKRLNTIRRDLKSVDDTNQELRRIDMAGLLGPPIGDRPRVREFVRALLLSGNGSLVFENSFVQWGSSEALRRVQPQVLAAFFGMRQKLKPFSSTVLFEDQQRSNPVVDEDDPAGSLVDGTMLSQYVYFAAERIAAYRARTLTLMAVADMDRLLMLGASPAPPASARLSAEQLTEFVISRLESGG